MHLHDFRLPLYGHKICDRPPTQDAFIVMRTGLFYGFPSQFHLAFKLLIGFVTKSKEVELEDAQNPADIPTQKENSSRGISEDIPYNTLTRQEVNEDISRICFFRFNIPLDFCMLIPQRIK